MSESRTRHFINDRRMLAALESEDPAAAVRELLDEAWNKGMSAGQMKERLKSNGIEASIRELTTYGPEGCL